MPNLERVEKKQPKANKIGMIINLAISQISRPLYTAEEMDLQFFLTSKKY